MVQRWHFHDPAYNNVWLPAEDQWLHDWTVPLNPREMSSPFPERQISTRFTVSSLGRALLFEGAAQPPTWTFSGAILDYEHYERLLEWSDKPNVLRVTDHFGRTVRGIIQKFDPVPKRGGNRYWRHEYTMTMILTTKPTTPTVGV